MKILPTPDHHVPDWECAAILRFMQELLTLLRVTQYKILVMYDPCEDDAHGTMDFTEGRYIAKLSLNRDWTTYDNDIKFNTIIHETLHITHRGVNSVVEDQVYFMYAGHYTDFRRRYQEQMELFVDHYATFMEDNYNLREFWDKCYAEARQDDQVANDKGGSDDETSGLKMAGDSGLHAEASEQETVGVQAQRD